MSQICKICHWRPSTILELAGRLLLRSLEQRQIEGWSWWQNWPILCALQLCCWVEDLNSNGLGSRPASMKMYKSRRNGRKSPKNRKLHLKCGGLRWTQWSKILFSPFLYIGMTIEFTWGWPKSWFFSFCSPPYYKGRVSFECKGNGAMLTSVAILFNCTIWVEPCAQTPPSKSYTTAGVVTQISWLNLRRPLHSRVTDAGAVPRSYVNLTFQFCGVCKNKIKYRCIKYLITQCSMKWNVSTSIL